MHFLIEIPAGRCRTPDELFVIKPEMSLHLEGNDFTFYAWGDPIISPEFRSGLQANRNARFIVNNLYGHYYYLLHDSSNGELKAGNSLFSILPVYYHQNEHGTMLSDNAFTVARHAGLSRISKRFILETALFNYPLFNHAVIEGISLLPSNSSIVASDGKLDIVKHTEIEDLFPSNPVSARESAGRLTKVFLRAVEKYLPGDDYYHALTGGFDGRTLCAASRYHKKTFSAYCFGTDEAPDRKLAKQVAAKSDISFYDIVLGEEYFRDHALEAGKSFVTGSSGTGTFARAHYIYASRLLAERTKYIVTGNFGSEIFRAVHVPGVVISPNLLTLFLSRDRGEAAGMLRSCNAWKWLNHEVMDSVMKGLEGDLDLLPCFNAGCRRMSRNMQFYIFVFEELFRKYFGAEMVNQFGLLRNRTPFLDMEFLRELLATRFAGIHSDFFEDNPLKRYKGQMLYAYIINEAFPLLGKLPTDRGYRPADLISRSGLPAILMGYLRKEAGKRHHSADPYGVRRAWMGNRAYYETLPLNEEYFVPGRLTAGSVRGYSNEAASYYSLVYLDYYAKQLLKGDGKDISAN